MRSLIVENSLLRGLAANPAIVQQFPLLSPLASVLSANKKNCSCRGHQNAALDQAAKSAREAVRGLSGPDLERFKTIVGADELQIPFVDADGATRFDKR